MLTTIRRWICRTFHDHHVEWSETEIFTVCSDCGTRTEGMPLGFQGIQYTKPQTKPFWYRTSKRKYVRIKRAKFTRPAVIYDIEPARRKRQA